MNWRIDQAWGAAMIGGAIHDASGGYYGNTRDRRWRRHRVIRTD